MGYNWGEAFRKAVIQAGFAFFTQAVTLKRIPNIDELWIAAALAGLAFFVSLQKEEVEVKTTISEIKSNPKPKVSLLRLVRNSIFG